MLLLYQNYLKFYVIDISLVLMYNFILVCILNGSIINLGIVFNQRQDHVRFVTILDTPLKPIFFFFLGGGICCKGGVILTTRGMILNLFGVWIFTFLFFTSSLAVFVGLEGVSCVSRPLSRGVGLRGEHLWSCRMTAGAQIAAFFFQ